MRAPTGSAVAAGALAFVWAIACSSPTTAPDAGPPLATVDPQRAWSRDAAVATGADAIDAGLPVAETSSRAVLDEILAAAEKPPPAATDPKGGTLIGSDTGAAPGGSATPAASARAPAVRPMNIDVGNPEIEPDVASPTVEREGRAQLYWSLVQRCRAADGSILPPEVITLRFTIDSEGFVVPGTIQSTASEPRWQEAASCMLRELSAASFRAPPSARGVATRVTATVPSVD